MTTEEAIKILQVAKAEIEWSAPLDYQEAFNMGISAIEKQIPKEPVKSKKPRYGMGYDYYDWECPTCRAFIALEPDIARLRKVHHCKCGQAISYTED